MRSLFSTSGLARASARHPWRVVSMWVLFMALAFVSVMGLSDVLTTESTFVNEPESVKGYDLLEERLRGETPVTETVIIRSDSATIDDPAFKQVVEQTTAHLLAMDGVVKSAANYYQTQNAALVSEDKHTTLIPVTLVGALEDAEKNADEYVGTVNAQRVDGFEVYTVGDASINDEFNSIAEKDLQKAEGIGLPIALLILVVVFGALVAAGAPVILALVSIFVALGLTAVVGRLFELSFFVTNMITMIGLAVGIDYALFIIERYREERRRGIAKIDAIGIAGGTASKAVLFSGITVVLALLGMLLIPTTIFRSLGAGAVLVVLVAVFASLTLIPAFLSLVGDNIDQKVRTLTMRAVTSPVRAFRKGSIFAKARAIVLVPIILAALPLLLLFSVIELIVVDVVLRAIFRTKSTKSSTAATPSHDEATHKGFWGQITRVVMAHPVVAVVLAVTLLIGAAIPYFDINTGQSGVETLPEGDIRTSFTILQEDFYVGMLAPVEIVVDGNIADAAVKASIDSLVAQLGQNEQFGPATVESNAAGDPSASSGQALTLVSAPMATDANSSASYDAIESLRQDVIPAVFNGTSAAVYVSGDTAFNHDFNTVVEDYTPIVFAFVLGLSFILLMLAFRSIVVPFTAIIMNLLSVGAAYGLIVLVFQKGYGADLFGFQQVPTIESWLPIFLFCVLFGLSMDYHVFLLSRIREHFDGTGRNRESVAAGLQSTAKIITGAALIMVAVFAGFASGKLVMMQQMGFGLAVAVFLDATIVRSVLVPATMALLGNLNWYMPRWLHWLPDLRVEGAETHVPATVPVATGGDD